MSRPALCLYFGLSVFEDANTRAAAAAVKILASLPDMLLRLVVEG